MLRERSVIFGSLKAQGLFRKEVLAELRKWKIDPAVITETRKKVQGTKNLGRYDHFHNFMQKECRTQVIWFKKTNEMYHLLAYRLTIIGAWAINEYTTVYYNHLRILIECFQDKTLHNSIMYSDRSVTCDSDHYFVHADIIFPRPETNRPDKTIKKDIMY